MIKFWEDYHKAILLGAFLACIVMLIWTQWKLDALEIEHNAIIDRLDQVENTIVETIEDYHSSEEFVDGEELGD